MKQNRNTYIHFTYLCHQWQLGKTNMLPLYYWHRSSHKAWRKANANKYMKLIEMFNNGSILTCFATWFSSKYKEMLCNILFFPWRRILLEVWNKISVFFSKGTRRNNLIKQFQRERDGIMYFLFDLKPESNMTKDESLRSTHMKPSQTVFFRNI